MSESQQGKWAQDEVCFNPAYICCWGHDGIRCEYWRGGCQARYLPPPKAKAPVKEATKEIARKLLEGL